MYRLINTSIDIDMLSRLETKAILFAVLIGVALMLIPIFAQTSDTADGSFTLNAAPTVAGVDFVDNAYATTSSLTPDDTTLNGLNFTVTHSAGIADLLNITIYIFDDSDHGADYNTVSTTGSNLISAVWIEADKANGTSGWGPISQGSFAAWTYNDANSVMGYVPDGAPNDLEFSFQFDISWAALAASDWNATVHVFDDDAGIAETDSAAETVVVTMNNNFDVSFTVTTFSWGNDIQPDSVNNTHGAVVIQIRANAAWEIRLDSTDFTGGAGADIDATDVLIWDEDGSPGGISLAIKTIVATMPTGSTWDAQSAMGSEANVTRTFYMFLTDTGSGLFAVGQLYTTTTTVLIQADA